MHDRYLINLSYYCINFNYFTIVITSGKSIKLMSFFNFTLALELNMHDIGKHSVVNTIYIYTYKKFKNHHTPQ